MGSFDCGCALLSRSTSYAQDDSRGEPTPMQDDRVLENQSGNDRV
jgi:hypothetical protein